MKCSSLGFNLHKLKRFCSNLTARVSLILDASLSFNVFSLSLYENRNT